MGLVAARDGQLDRALELIGKAVALNPRHAPEDQAFIDAISEWPDK